MSTELQRQVAAFKKQHVETQSLKEGRPSIFLTAQEAAGVDVSTVHEAAVDGLKALAQYDSRFQDFFNNLLHPSSVEVQRELKTKEENNLLNKDINRLLHLLSPWAFEGKAHLVLEYLVRRYRVHEFNTDSLLKSLLVSHDSKIFARIVQLCKIADGPWSFLSGVKHTGVPLPRSLIVKRVIKNAWLLEVLAENVLDTLRIGGLRKLSKENNNVGAATLSGVQRALTFFTAVVVEASEQTAFDDARLRHIYVYLSEGLKTHFNPSLNQHQLQVLCDWKTSACLIVSQLSRKTRFGGPLGKALCKGLAVSLLNAKSGEIDPLRQTIAENVLTTACILSQHSQLVVSSKFLSALFQENSGEQRADASSWLFSMLSQLNDYDVSSLLAALSWATFKHLVGEERDPDDTDLVFSPSNMSSFLCRIVQSGSLREQVAQDLLLKTLNFVQNQSIELQSKSDLADALIRFVKVVAHWMPRTFDIALQEVVSAQSDAPKKIAVKTFLAGVFSDSSLHFAESLKGDTLFIALNSPIKELRIQALELYATRTIEMNLVHTTEYVSLAESVLRSCEDGDSRIACVVWKKPVLRQLCLSLSSEQVFQHVQCAVDHWLHMLLTNMTEAQVVLASILEALDVEEVISSALSSSKHCAWLHCFVICIAGQFDGSKLLSTSQLRNAAVNVIVALSKNKSPLLSSVDCKNLLNSAATLSSAQCILSAMRDALIQNNSLVANIVEMIHAVVAQDDMLRLTTMVTLIELISSCVNPVRSSIVDALLPLLLELVKSSDSALTVPFLGRAFSVDLSLPAADRTSLSLVDNIASMNNSNGIRLNIVKTLLCAAKQEKLELIDGCVRSLFPGNAFSLCAHLSLQELGHLQLVGLSMLAAAVDSIIQTPEKECDKLLFASIVSTWACTQSSVDARRTGLHIVRQLSRIAPQSSLRIGSEKLHCKGEDLLQLFSAILDRESAILLQEDALIALVRESVASSKTLCTVLWMTLKDVEWSAPLVTASCVRVLQSSSLELGWQCVQSLLKTASGKFSNTIVFDSLSSFLLSSFPHSPHTLQKSIIQFLSESIVELSAENHETKTFILSVVANGLVNDVAPHDVDVLYQVLMEQQLSRPGDAMVLSALSSLNTQPATSLLLLSEELKKFPSHSGDQDTVEEKNVDLGNGLAVPLQRLIALIETAAPTVVRHRDVNAAELSLLAVHLFSALHITNRPETKAILSIEYYKAVVLEAIHQTLRFMEANNMLQTLKNNDVVKKSQDKKGQNHAVQASYTIDRTEGDLQAVMICLGTLRSSQIQNPSLGIMHTLIQINPNLAFVAIKELGTLLSSAATAVNASKEKFLGGILELIMSVLEQKSSSASEEKLERVSSQEVVQSLCMKLSHMTIPHRLTLLRCALRVMQHRKFAGTLIVHVLLCHTVAAYESEHDYIKSRTESIETICFSRAAQRRAKRALSSSGPEEFYLLAQSIFLDLHAADQLSTMSNLLRGALDLIAECAQQQPEKHATDLQAHTSVQYVMSLVDNGSDGKAKNLSESFGGFAATLALLHLEFVLDLMEHKNFHASQAKVLVGANSSNFQGAFLETADIILRLVSLSELVRKKNTASAEKVHLRLESQLFKISSKTLMEIVLSWSLNALQSLQRLLDGPSFVSIVQELLNHDLLSIRQRAVLVLKERLQGMMLDKTINIKETSLFFDLSSKMRDLIKSFFSRFIGKNEESEELIGARNAHSALAQSAIMCLDVLMHFLGQTESWKDELLAIGKELLDMLPVMYVESANGTGQSLLSSKSLESKKLLGSVVLCCATVFKVLHAAALPLFPVVMQSLLHMYGTESSLWRSGQVIKGEVPDARAPALFLRSVLSSINIIVASLPTFVHPHLPALLPLMLESYVGFGSGNAELSGLSDDANTGLNIIATKLPARLLLPAVAKCLPLCMGQGHRSAQRMAQLVLQVSKSTDRSSTLTHLSKWMVISLELMDYRRKHGDFTTATNDVEETVCDGVVSLCLKLTESELKTFLLRIVEWRTQNVESSKDDEKSSSRRSSSFYALIKTLVEKLKFLFYPTMSLFWNAMIEDLADTKEKITKSLNSFPSDVVTKKRKRNECIVLDDHTRGVVNELLDVGRTILTTLQSLCDNTTSKPFMAKKRYEETYPKVVSFLLLRDAFVDESSYLQYVQSNVTTTLCRLCLTTTQDSLWKPINHQVLLQTRHSHPSVRKAAVTTLKSLFQEVGEEYILLLPECLPFISELLEDDNEEVVACTREAIEVIEDLSGENLDSYLKQ